MNRGIGHTINEIAHNNWLQSDFHQQILTTDGKAVKFYEALGFKRVGKTKPMWIYSGEEH